MRIGIAYNLREEAPEVPGAPVDHAEEFDSPATIDAIAQVLREHVNGQYETEEAEAEAHAAPAAEQLLLPIMDRPIGDLCPDCGQATFIPTEGCRKCYACGYSEC